MDQLFKHLNLGIKESSEVLGEQGTSHINSLFTVVVSVILKDYPQRNFYQFVGHVPEEERLLELTIYLRTHVRQKFSLQEQAGESDSLVSSELSYICSPPSDKIQRIFLGKNLLCLMKTWPNCISDLGVVGAIEADSLDDVFVACAAQSSEQNYNGYRLVDHRHHSLNGGLTVGGVLEVYDELSIVSLAPFHIQFE